MNEQWRKHVTMEPGKRGGRPCIRGMSITVYDVLSYLAAGMTPDEILDDFPYLTAEDVFPGSSHVQTAGLDRADDDQAWEYARLNGYAIVTKDEDYYNLSILRGCPPKVIWLQMGNCTTAQMRAIFRARCAETEAFDQDPSLGVLVLN